MGVALRDILADYKHPVQTESLKGIAAVDANNTLYQFLSIIRQPDGTPLMDSGGRVTSHLSGIFFRTMNFLEQGIMPVFVFDGPPPDLKRKTLDARREIREDAKEKWKKSQKEGDTEGAFRHAMASSKVDNVIISSAKELLTRLGIPLLDAPSEGEAQASHMLLKGDVTYVVSQDYDTLLFGANTLVRNLTISGKRRLHGRMITVQPEKVLLDEVLSGLSLTREDLINIAILVGTDFNEGASGIGAKTGLKKVKNGEFERVIAEKLPELDPEPVREFFLNPPVTDQYSLAWNKPDHEKVRSLLCDEYGFSPERINPMLEKVTGKGVQKTLDRWF